MIQLWHTLLSVLFPLTCRLCKSEITEGVLCANCRKKYLKIRFLEPSAFDCPELRGICLLYDYEDVIKELLHDAKFRPSQRKAARLGGEVMQTESLKVIKERWHLPDATVAVPIPTSRERIKLRGYELPEKIFHKYIEKNNLAWQDLLYRQRATLPQFKLKKNERRKNVQGCFELKSNKCLPRDILLVDDIFTSGATMEEAAKFLNQRGANNIWALAFAGGGK
ncbi:MAG TPA: ComF family protein [Candidatus Avacidaminococcus intestinavium]|uniref:ComF family protein n=1 Tax=Candidatus Avacidaminococcus intestinavium TaxID=2840684 RepID=A0A9D1MNM6_9FIRM|nr:ComF family protein [Candidatus Avacidaminococcus intestinavium]